MLVKVLIKRKVKQEKEAALLDLITQLRTLASKQPGYISGETLRSADNPEEYLVISTWQAMTTGRSGSRKQAGARVAPGQIDEILGKKTAYRGYQYPKNPGLAPQIQGRYEGGLIPRQWNALHQPP